MRSERVYQSGGARYRYPMTATGSPSEAREGKRRLRERHRIARQRRGASAQAGARRAVAEVTRGFAALSAARSVAGYAASDGEIDVSVILDEARARGATVLLPRQRDDGGLDWVAAPDGGSLIPGPWGILEPPGPAQDPGRLPLPALLLVPAVALGRDGSRLGRGGGAYDRILGQLRALGWTIVGVCFASDLVDTLPTEPHDVRVEAVLTESGVTVCAPPARVP